MRAGLVLHVTARQLTITTIKSTDHRFVAENIMGRTLHQRVPLKSRNAVTDFGLLAGSALLLATMLAWILL